MCIFIKKVNKATVTPESIDGKIDQKALAKHVPGLWAETNAVRLECKGVNRGIEMEPEFFNPTQLMISN